MVPIYEGWFCFGGTEIINNARAQGYAETASQIQNRDYPSHLGTAFYCDINWFSKKFDECNERMFVALEEEFPYEAQYIDPQAPWFSNSSGYSAPFSPSRKFLGAYCISVSSLSDSTRDVPSTEGILSGGVIGRERLSMPRFRFRVQLTAVDGEGIEYGINWLNKVLSEQSCSTHGPSCGSSDLTFLAACPPIPDNNAPFGIYVEKLDQLTRKYHDVKCIEGPVVTERYNRKENSWGAVVEFTLQAGVPNMFGIAAPYLPIPEAGESIIQDVPMNLVPYPSAEIGYTASGVGPVLARNYSTNPSLEVNATGWSSTVTLISGASPSPYVTNGRVTGEESYVGTASYRNRCLGTATVASGRARFNAWNAVTITGRPAGSRISAHVWAALRNYAAASTLYSVRAYVFFYNGATLVGTVEMEPGPGGIANNTYSATGLQVPAGATIARVEVRGEFNWASGTNPTDTRMYVDAVAVTVP